MRIWVVDLKIYTIMKKNIKYLFFGFLIVFCSCSENIDYSKDDHFSTRKIRDGLYSENYRIGVYGWVYAVYLTDSVSFRKYVCKRTDYEWIDYEEIDEDTYVLYKGEYIFNNKERILEKKTYKISELQKEGKFE